MRIVRSIPYVSTGLERTGAVLGLSDLYCVAVCATKKDPTTLAPDRLSGDSFTAYNEPVLFLRLSDFCTVPPKGSDIQSPLQAHGHWAIGCLPPSGYSKGPSRSQSRSPLSRLVGNYI